jgi:hypothetical protein
MRFSFTFLMGFVDLLLPVGVFGVSEAILRWLIHRT